jgi:glutamyl-tRNA synthetase
MTSVVGRFAPSPTGRLHLGNLRTAMLAWLQARRAGGRFILRIEDIDPQRSLPSGTADILADLAWLGFDWDEGPDVGGPHAPYLQSERRERYRALVDAWVARGLAYPCTCSRKDIAAAGAPHPGDEGPVYRGTCRGGAANPARPPAVRFRVPPGAVAFRDEVLGPQTQDVAALTGDFVVWRNDGWPSYQLAVVADDAAMGVTDVVRGADLLGSVGRQLLLYRALDARPPRWHHVPMWFDLEGARLAKRNPAQTAAAMRAAGERPARVVARMAASLGWPVPAEITLAELLDHRFAGQP